LHDQSDHSFGLWLKLKIFRRETMQDQLGGTNWFLETRQLLQKVVVVVEVVLLVGEHDPVQVGKVSVQIEGIVVGSTYQIIFAALKKEQEQSEDVGSYLSMNWREGKE
jgi:hypothetical protein